MKKPMKNELARDIALAKGKSVKEIADELEEDEQVIRKILEKL